MLHSDTEQQEKWNTTNQNFPVSNSTNLNPPENCEKPKFSRQLGGLAHVTFQNSFHHLEINVAMLHYRMPQLEKWNTTINQTPGNPTKVKRYIMWGTSVE